MQKSTAVSRTFAERCARTADCRGKVRRTGPQKKCAGKFLTGDVAAVVEVDVREVQKARERAEVA